MKKIFLDANIVLDLLDSTRNSHNISKNVFEYLINSNYTIVIPEDILTTIYYIVKNKKAVLEFFETIITYWEIVSFGTKVISDAINICKSNSVLDFEDVIQSLCAKESNCEAIISNDNTFYNCGIPVMKANEFIDPFKLDLQP